MKFNDTERAILAHFSPGFGGTEIPDWIYRYLENGLGGITLFSSIESQFEILEIDSINRDISASINSFLGCNKKSPTSL